MTTALYSPMTIEQLLDRQLFLTDSGLETTLLFHHGYELRYFAAFDLINQPEGKKLLREYFEQHAAIALSARTGFILESPTWRASRDWAEKLGYNLPQLRDAIRNCVEQLHDIRREYAINECPILVSGCVGPRGDGYTADIHMSTDQARDYHSEQIATMVDAGVDMISAITMNYCEEAIGISLAARSSKVPVVISFTTETDGRLPDGTTLHEAIAAVDEASGAYPLYFMINCAHPDHFQPALAGNSTQVQRIRGIRANASRMSHAELDEAEELDSGNPAELAELYRQLRENFPQFAVLGGCCGTDHRHVAAISEACCH